MPQQGVLPRRAGLLILVVVAMLALGACTRTAPTVQAPSPTVSTTISETADTPAQSLPTSTPVPPTATRLPPTSMPTQTPAPPTPTPTLEQQKFAVAGLDSWSGSSGWSAARIRKAQDDLCKMQEEYPDLFAATISEPWIDPTPARVVEWTWRAIEDLLVIAETGGEEATIKLTRMPFMDNLAGQTPTRLDVLIELAALGEEKFAAFIDEATLNGGITDDHQPKEIYPLYVEAADSGAWSRIEGRSWRGRQSNHAITDLSIMRVRHPELFWAFTDNYVNKQARPSGVAVVLDMAVIDEDLAIRMAHMPISAEFAGSADIAWKYVAHAWMINARDTSGVLALYEGLGGINNQNIGLFLVDITGVFDPRLREKLNDFPWIKYGIDPPTIRTENGELLVFPSREQRVVEYLTWASYIDEKAVLDRLLEREWLQNRIDAPRAVTVDYLLRQLPDEVSLTIVDMSFLDDPGSDEWSSLVRLGNLFVGDRKKDPLPLLHEVLDHPRIDGEITVQNQIHLEQAINDALRSLEED